LEVILAVAILSFGLLAVASMQVSAIRGNAFANDVTEGTTWGADKLEKLLQKGLLDYDDPDLADTDGDASGGLSNNTSATADHNETQGDYRIFWNVAENHILENTKTIQVIVQWGDHGQTKEMSLRGIVPEIV
jgi:Tfp pilus assembly protein PilV